MDPVCGLPLFEPLINEISEYGGATYCFCCRDCRLKFEDDPGRLARGRATAGVVYEIELALIDGGARFSPREDRVT